MSTYVQITKTYKDKKYPHVNITQSRAKIIQTMVSELYFDYDRLSESGQKSLDIISNIIGVHESEKEKGLTLLMKAIENHEKGAN